MLSANRALQTPRSKLLSLNPVMLLSVVLTGVISGFWILTGIPTGSASQNLAFASGFPLGASPSPTATCAPATWTQVQSRSTHPAGGDEFHAASALLPTDMWAVGNYLNLNDPLARRTEAQHWNGRTWSVVASPNVGSTHNYLTGVAMVAADDVWMVGSYGASFEERTLIEHWDGTQITIVPSPNAVTETNFLLGIDAVSSNDIWAVGYVEWSFSQTLIEHWDGTAWNIVPSPNTGERSGLFAVTAIAANDVWAVGSSGFQPEEHTLVLHWDGVIWTIVPSPSPGNDGNWLRGVSAVSPTDIWAVGSRAETGGGVGTLTLHWDGSAWSVVPSPSVGTSLSSLTGVAGVAANDAWAVGYSYSSGNPLVEHWDGTAWSVVTIQIPATNSSLFATVALSAQDVWVFGDYSMSSSTKTLAVHYTSPCAGGTPTPSPTPCPLTFTDVHPADYFYVPVRHLYCAGVISGYADNTFRPYNNTTRGQLCKIVALAEGWYLSTSTTPTFTDVPPTHPFYRYIETAALNGVISGYSDGTFLPFNDVTRGQLCKIIVNSEAWPDYTPSVPTFRDVSLGDPFYRYIETAYHHGIISGYSCGAGCLEFRPGSNATRGQISKMVYNAITGAPVP